MATRQYRFSDFTGVDVGGAFEVDVRHSDSYGVTVEADSHQLQVVKVSKDGDTLRIGRQWNPLAWIPTGTRPKATVTMPVLKGLSLHGATTGSVSGFSSSEDFRMELSGASRAKGDLTVGDAKLVVSGASRAELSGSAGDLTAEVSGASHVAMAGSAGDLAAEVSGAGHVDLDALEVRDANVRLSGASRGTVNVAGRLDAQLSGASVLRWTGEPTMGDIRTSGASRLEKEQNAPSAPADVLGGRSDRLRPPSSSAATARSGDSQ